MIYSACCIGFVDTEYCRYIYIYILMPSFGPQVIIPFYFPYAYTNACKFLQCICKLKMGISSFSYNKNGLFIVVLTV